MLNRHNKKGQEPVIDGDEGFLMNVAMAAGGYPWMVIPLSTRKIYMYMAVLKRASVGEDMATFAGISSWARPERSFRRAVAAECPKRSLCDTRRWDSDASL